jgi:hypothetical protein
VVGIASFKSSGAILSSIPNCLKSSFDEFIGLMPAYRSMLFFQVNDAAFYTAILYTYYRTKLEGGGRRGEGCHPSDLLCWLTVIWPGAPTDSMGGGVHILTFPYLFLSCHRQVLVALFNWEEFLLGGGGGVLKRHTTGDNDLCSSLPKANS